MRILKVLTVALALSTSMTTVANAVPLVALIAGPAFAATIGGQLLGALFGLGASYLFSQIAGALFPQAQTTQSSDTTNSATEVSYGERVARGGVFGTTLVGGHVVHLNEYDDAKVLQYVGIVGDCKHTGLASIYINGKQYALEEVSVGSNNEHRRYNVDTFGTSIEVRFHDGRAGQAADTNLVTQSSGWTSDKTFSNMAYFVAEITSDKEKFNGIPELKVVPIGLVCYDVRKDGTAGGSGAHRFNDPSTWEYTENPAVMAYHYCRGFFFNGKRVLGVGYTVGEINVDTFVAAMNVCDEVVEDPDEIERPRYTCHFAFADTDQFSNVLDKLCHSMGGYHTEIQGQIAIFAGKAQTSVLTITDADLLSDEAVVYNPGRPGEFLITGVQGTYTHSQDYNPTPYAAIEPAEFELDNWYPHVVTVDFPEVDNAHQAFLLAKQFLYTNRLQSSAVIALDYKDLIVQVNDWITWNSSRPVRGERDYKVAGVRYDLKRKRMYLTLQEISASAYDDTATPGDVVEPDRERPASQYLTAVSNFDIAPVTLQGTSGNTVPALEFTYDAIIDPGVTAVEIYYRVKATVDDPAGPIFKITDSTVSDGVIRATNGVAPGSIHEAYALLVSIPGRTMEVRDWDDAVEALFPTDELTAVVEVGDDSITLIKLSQDVKNLLGLVSGYAPGSLWDAVQQLRDRVEAQANAALTYNVNWGQETKLLFRHIGASTAAVAIEKEVRATEDSALASLIADVAAGVGNVLASGLLSFTATVEGGGAEATIVARVRAQVGDTFSDATMFLHAFSDGMGGTDSEAGFFANKFFLASDDGSDAEFPFVYSSGVLTINAIKFNYFESIANSGGTPIVVIDGTTGFMSLTIP